MTEQELAEYLRISKNFQQWRYEQVLSQNMEWKWVQNITKLEVVFVSA